MKWALALSLLAGCGTPSLQPDAGCEGRRARFERACATAADCALLHHQLDCCGSEVALGVSSAGLTAGQQLERACVAVAPHCRCAALPSVAEDGKVFPEAAALQLRCTAGKCESFVN